jgi:hypothetical protein
VGKSYKSRRVEETSEGEQDPLGIVNECCTSIKLHQNSNEILSAVSRINCDDGQRTERQTKVAH